jgi:predicted RecA/RadA family phage recombinase
MTNGRIPDHEMRRSLGAEVATNPSTNWAALAHSLARVKEVQYEELKCTLVVLTGESQVSEFTGVDITVPCGGKRHFFGALPERGDICYVGWGVRESAGTASSKTPIIVGWAPQAAWMGHEWIAHQAMQRGENMDTPSDRTVTSGTFDRVRFKMRHLSPGNVFASSSQGSDLVLDESVLISNRRGNEIRLRDSDQALITRSLQNYQAMAGARVYSGMVHREARLLPSTMFSDGTYWDNSPQTIDNNTPRGTELLGDSPVPNRFLTPGQIFTRTVGATESLFVADQGEVPARLDPFVFLQWGGLTDARGFRTDAALPGGVSNTIYGGKAMYRVGLANNGRVDNAIARSQNSNTPPVDSLTEYRVEVTHTSNGTLPVTEQTDGFDSERLPTSPPTQGNPLGSGRQPFIEWVMGSVVGNDPFSFLGRPLYGIPLRAQIRDASGNVSPSLVSALNSPLGEHSATLFRLVSVVPGLNGVTSSSFTSFTKDGRFRAYLAGGPVSAEVATEGDLSLAVGGVLDLSLAGGIRINGTAGPGNVGLNLGSATGAVVIRGGGALNSTTGAQSTTPSLGNVTPSVVVDGTQGVMLRSDAAVNINATDAVNIANTGSINLNAQNQVSIRSGQNVSLSAQTHSVVLTGSETVNYGGPENSDPSNGPSRQVTFSSTPATGNLGGVVDRYRMVYGSRTEEFQLPGSNHTTSIIGQGNLTYETNQGRFRARAGTNQMDLDSVSGLSTTVAVGDASTTVSTGGITQTAQTDLTLRATTGTATLSGAQGVKLVSPGSANGGIVCGSDLDPLTGIPYSTFLVPRGQSLSAT